MASHPWDRSCTEPAGMAGSLPALDWPDEQPLTTGDIARLLHVNRVTVFGWIRAGKLPAYRLPGGHYRVAPAAFRAFLTSHRLPLALTPALPKRVLVVEDDAAVRDAFETFLAGAGYHVVLAVDGGEALRRLEAEQFDLVFLDILLPDVGGDVILGAIKRHTPATPVVIITGYPHHERTLAALDYGPAMLLAKPIKLPDIEAVLQIVFKA